MPPPTIPVRSTGLTSYLSGSIKKILLAHSKTFLCIQPHLLSIPGGSDDWAKGGAGIKYSFTVELPDTGRHGFILPPRYSFTVELPDTGRHGFILPSCRYTLWENLTDTLLLSSMWRNFRPFSLWLSKLYVTETFAIASSVKYSEIRKKNSNSVYGSYVSSCHHNKSSFYLNRRLRCFIYSVLCTYSVFLGF